MAGRKSNSSFGFGFDTESVSTKRKFVDSDDEDATPKGKSSQANGHGNWQGNGSARNDGGFKKGASSSGGNSFDRRSNANNSFNGNSSFEKKADFGFGFKNSSKGDKGSAMEAYDGGRFDSEDAGKTKKRQKSTEDADEKVEKISDKNYPFSEFPQITSEMVDALKARGIVELFPIQGATFLDIYNRKDIIGRARTGSGKTLAFVLPIVERLRLEPAGKRRRGRQPRVVVMAPTRELANQIHQDFEFCSMEVLSTACFYGGVPYIGQKKALQDGLDVLVGTPGRIADHIQQGTLMTSNVEVVILDEADEMLSMGFIDQMETFLQACPAERQTLLFSATMPFAIRNLSRKYLKHDAKTFDLIKDKDNQTANLLTHLCCITPPTERPDVIADLLKFYAGSFKKTIVFSDTKAEANEISQHKGIGDCQVLHGDIPQNQREVTMAAFRNGKFNILIATDVAARGIDVSDVELVIQAHPPSDVETYIHRSGRTARAGKSGINITLFSKYEVAFLRAIEAKINQHIKRIGPPQQADIFKRSERELENKITEVPKEKLSTYLPLAEKLITKMGPEALAAVLSLVDKGDSTEGCRSIISATFGMVGYTLTESYPITSKSQVWGLLRRYGVNDDRSSAIFIYYTTDPNTIALDIALDLVPTIEKIRASCTKFKLLTERPELAEEQLTDVQISNAIQQKRDKLRMLRSRPRR